MDAIWERNAVGTPPTLPASPQTGFPSKSAPGGPTVPGDYWYHMMTQEIRNAIIGAGLDPDAGNLEQLSEALLAHYERAASYTPPGPNATTTTLQARVSERISLSRNLTVVEMLSIGAGLGQFDLTAKLQETLQYALDIGGCIVEAPAGVVLLAAADAAVGGHPARPSVAAARRAARAPAAATASTAAGRRAAADRRRLEPGRSGAAGRGRR